MITFEQARQAVIRHLLPRWSANLGALVTLPTGYEDDRFYRVIAGAREALVDGDDDFQLMDAPAFLVDKATGAVSELNVIDNFDRLDAMRPTH